MRTQTFKKSTIKSAFRNTRLISYNLKDVFQKSALFHDAHKQLLHLHQTLSTKWLQFALPPYIVQWNKKSGWLPPWKKTIGLCILKFSPTLISGSVSNSHRCSIAKRDLEITHRKAIARAAQTKLKGRVAQKGGVITVRDVRAKITKRPETEVEKAKWL